MQYILPQNMWQGFSPIAIDLPDDWDVEIHGIEADNLPPLTREQIRERINRPFGAKPLREIAKGRQRVCIAFDDISRATPTRILAELVLEELHGAGIKKEQIRFICALGTHGAHNRRDFVCKLGEEIVSQYRVYNHNCYDNLTEIGRTGRGFPVQINRELMSCDLKIGLGAVIPHLLNSFGGGGKLLFPGLASIDTIEANHRAAMEFLDKYHISGVQAMGDLRVRGMRDEIEEMTRMVGEFFKVDCLYNSKGRIVDCYAGDPIEEYYAAIPAAQKLYVCKPARDKDVVIVNANARANEANIAASLGSLGLSKDRGGDMVLINHTSLGQVIHYMFGTFGDKAVGRMFGLPAARPFLRRMICYAPYHNKADEVWYGEMEKQIYVKSWDEVLKLLKETHGPGTKASVLIDGTMQYFEIDPNPVYAGENNTPDR
jgi:nickel-dependent lactate racemase